MKCYLEGCNLEAAGEDRYFAYCSLEHKAKCVNIDINGAPKKKLTIREIQVRLKQMGKNAPKIEEPLTGQQQFDLLNQT